MQHEVSGAGYWSERYRADTAGWDLGGPCPVFVAWLERKASPPVERVAFPGCGHGHDLRHWVERGYDAVGFDFAELDTDLPIEKRDVFTLGESHKAAFDIIVEYTCYCAIDPARRPEYVRALRGALAPGGIVLALLFPIGPRDGGPPFGVLESEIETVWGAEFEVVSVTTPAESVKPRQGRELLVELRDR